MASFAPVVAGQTILIPQGAKPIGSIDSVQRFGLGLKQNVATVRFEFHTLRLPDAHEVTIYTQLIEVENAKERVDDYGTVHGIHPVASVISSVSLFTVPLTVCLSGIGAAALAAQSLLAPAVNPEIHFPSGTEVLVQLTTAMELTGSISRRAGMSSPSPREASQARTLLDASEPWARLGGRPSDAVNLIITGNRAAMKRAFLAAGWAYAERKTPTSLYRIYHALCLRIGFRSAPVDTLTLNGAVPEVVYEKGLDTIQKRHHIRLWKDPHRAGVWLGAADEDTAFRFETAHWQHFSALKIDNERAKVVNDLSFTGCVDTAGLMPRSNPHLFQGIEEHRQIITDNQVALLQLNDCRQPNVMPGAGTPYIADLHRNRTMRTVSSVENDKRRNIFFTAYNAFKLIAGYRSAAPLRTYPNTEIDPPGLSWLSSLPRKGNAPGGQP